MTIPASGSANGTHSSSVSDGKAPPSSQEAAQRMADAVAAEKDRGFDVAFNGPDLTITGTDANDAISIAKQQDGTLRVKAEGHSGYYDILPNVRDVTINAGGGNNTISVGSDIERPFTLIAAGGRNILRGGAGNDTIIGDGKDNTLYGGEGDDALRANGSFNRLDGGDGDDWIYGDNGDDSIRGGPGDDEIHGRGGKDDISGGKGNDIIFGGDGDDGISGGPGEDGIHGDDGDDALSGGTGRNNIHGEEGNDVVFAADVQDFISGGPGDDTVVRLYPETTGSEATVIDKPDEGSTAERAGETLANPDLIYKERKQ